jgi:hypothetical protein
MAGTIVADTLQDGAGASVPMDNAIYGSAKAWVNYNAAGAAIRSSYNVTSVTVIGTGNYQINFTNAFADANYCSIVTTVEAYSSGDYDLIGTLNQSASNCQMWAKNGAGTTYTPVAVYGVFFR